jgi:hypothetical protein
MYLLLFFIRLLRHWIEVEFAMNTGIPGHSLGLKGSFHKLARAL